MIALYLLLAVWMGVPCIMGACLALLPSAMVSAPREEGAPMAWLQWPALPSVVWCVAVATAAGLHMVAACATVACYVLPDPDWC